MENSVTVLDNSKMDERRNDRDSDLGDDSPMVSATTNNLLRKVERTNINGSVRVVMLNLRFPSLQLI